MFFSRNPLAMQDTDELRPKASNVVLDRPPLCRRDIRGKGKKCRFRCSCVEDFRDLA